MKALTAIYENASQFIDDNLIALGITGMVAAVPVSQWIESARPLLSQVVLIAGTITVVLTALRAIFRFMIDGNKWWKQSRFNKNKKL